MSVAGTVGERPAGLHAVYIAVFSFADEDENALGHELHIMTTNSSDCIDDDRVYTEWPGPHLTVYVVNQSCLDCAANINRII